MGKDICRRYLFRRQIYSLGRLKAKNASVITYDNMIIEHSRKPNIMYTFYDKHTIHNKLNVTNYNKRHLHNLSTDINFQIQHCNIIIKLDQLVHIPTSQVMPILLTL